MYRIIQVEELGILFTLQKKHYGLYRCLFDGIGKAGPAVIEKRIVFYVSTVFLDTHKPLKVHRSNQISTPTFNSPHLIVDEF